MPKITIKSRDLKILSKYFAKNKDLVSKYTDKAMKKSMLLLERNSKIEAPVLTGRLRSSIRTDIKPLESRLSVNVKYAIYVHDGTDRMRANPFLDRSIDKSEKLVTSYFTKATNNILNDIKNNG